MFRSTLMMLLVAGPAWAQSDPWTAPNPFEAHETNRSTPSEAEMGRQGGGVAAPMGAAQFHAGTMLLGVGGLFSYTSATNGKPEGGTAENSTLFTRITPSFGYMLTDRVELAIAPGLLLRQIDRGGSEGNTNEEAFLVELTARYFVPLSPAFHLFAGGGMGGSFGTSERSLVVTDEEGRDRDVTEQTSTSGFTLSLNTGAAYVLANQVQLRAGLELDWLTGTETIDSISKDLDLSTLSVGLAVAVHYLF